MPFRSRFTSAFPSRFASPPFPVELTTIRTATAMIARKPAPAASCSSFVRRSFSARIGNHFPFGARVADQPRGVQQEQDRHQDCAGDAPLADRLELEDLQVGQVDAEAEAAESDDEAAEAGGVVGEEGARQEQYVADDP